MAAAGPLAEPATANFAIHAGWLPERLPGMALRRTPHLLAADSGTDCDTFNCILGARLPDHGADPEIRAAIAGYGGRPFSWWVAPGDTPAGLGRLLEAAGLRAAEAELAMSRPLPAPPPAPGGLRIERVCSASGVRDFARVLAANWRPPDARVVAHLEKATALLLHPDCPLRLHVGYLRSEAVATAEATLTGDTVGLYNIATLASHRRRGYGSAMTLAALRDAHTAGAVVAVLQASADGAGLYQRLGFTPFGTITEYQPA